MDILLGQRDRGLVRAWQVRKRVFFEAQFEETWWREEHAVTTRLSLLQRWILAGGVDGSIRLLDLESSKTRRRRFAEGVISAVAWHDAGLFVSASDRTLRIWDAARFKSVCDWKLPGVADAAVSSSCVVAAACNDKTVRLCDPRTGAGATQLVGARAPLSAVCWGSQCLLCAADTAGEARLWDVRKVRRPVAFFDQHRPGPGPAQGPATAHDAAVVAVAATSRDFVTVGRDAACRKWAIHDATPAVTTWPRRFVPPLRTVCAVDLVASDDFVFFPSTDVVQVRNDELTTLATAGRPVALAFRPEALELYAVDDAGAFLKWKKKVHPRGTVARPVLEEADEDADLAQLRRDVLRARRAEREAAAAAADQPPAPAASEDRPPRRRRRRGPDERDPPRQRRRRPPADVIREAA